MTMTCPKCNYRRRAEDTAPETQCPSCGLLFAKYDPGNDLQMRLRRAANSGNWSGFVRADIPPEYHAQAAASLLATTTHSIPGRDIVRVIDVVSSECAFGMNLIKDFFTSITDVVGGRSGSTQKVLRDARLNAMAGLRAEAFAVGGDALVGVDLAYSEFSGGGKSMLFVVATGTAVALTSC